MGWDCECYPAPEAAPATKPRVVRASIIARELREARKCLKIALDLTGEDATDETTRASELTYMLGELDAVLERTEGTCLACSGPCEPGTSLCPCAEPVDA